jgi:hypothetical protein
LGRIRAGEELARERDEEEEGMRKKKDKIWEDVNTHRAL